LEKKKEHKNKERFLLKILKILIIILL